MENIKIQKIENITERRTKIIALTGEGIDAEEMTIMLLEGLSHLILWNQVALKAIGQD